ncbi:hypothetical protein KC19_VG174300 [Ceratodon purpureus]|uniref:Uncharacterized protein n=1 Tax=Ceratodon purpureus TaxID=3225 RepID=A0A8T0HS61_CERPU|nr:hypothetical protein KC19_VG174300 [Ceratodon purpureus]
MIKSLDVIQGIPEVYASSPISTTGKLTDYQRIRMDTKRVLSILIKSSEVVTTPYCILTIDRACAVRNKGEMLLLNWNNSCGTLRLQNFSWTFDLTCSIFYAGKTQ